VLRVDDVQLLLRKVKQGFDIDKERLLTTSLRKVVSVRDRMRLIIATRLQAKHFSFRLRTSSHTPSVPMNDAHRSFRRLRGGNAPSILQLLS
jgi:hypothetical protein